MAETDAAIVIPALNEADNLDALLDDCQAQTLEPAEVIVVDAGSTDGTADLLVRRQRNWPRLTVLTRPGANPPTARNAAIEAAGSRLIATVDAGSRIGPEWLAAMAEPVREANRPRVAVGVVVPDARSDFEQAAGWMTVRAFKPDDRPGPFGSSFLPPGRRGYCFTKQSWREAGGYPEELSWGEDKTFIARMREAGCDVAVAPDAVVSWRPRSSLAALYRQYEKYARGDVMAKLDRQNELVTLFLYSGWLVLAVRAVRGGVPDKALLGAATVAYFAVFTGSAIRGVRPRRALLWVPAIRLTIDVAKMHGFIAETLRPSTK